MTENQQKPNEQPQEKMIPINKYSIYDMKNAIDTKIIESLEQQGFVENYSLSNMKIFVGLFCLSFTALAYFYPKPFPENYNVVLFSVIMYAIGSVAYFYVEKYLIKQIIYSGFNEAYISALRRGKKEKLKCIKISSDIKDHSHTYELWFDFVNLANQKMSSEKIQIDCTKLCDERGYVFKDLVCAKFKEILHDELNKLI